MIDLAKLSVALSLCNSAFKCSPVLSLEVEVDPADLFLLVVMQPLDLPPFSCLIKA